MAAKADGHLRLDACPRDCRPRHYLALRFPIGNVYFALPRLFRVVMTMPHGVVPWLSAWLSNHAFTSA